MRAVVCRVNHASVSVEDRIAGRIGRGLLVYAGVMSGDDESDATWMAEKLAALRLFRDEQDKLNRSVRDIGGGILLIPNFTLAGRTRKGTRPSFCDAAAPDAAAALFSRLAVLCKQHVSTETGVFGARMIIDAQFDGPVTVIVDSRIAS